MGQDTITAIWITGRSASGKSTTASGLYNLLVEEWGNVVLIDADTIRRANKLTGYTAGDRLKIFYEYIHLNKVAQEQGIIPITATLCGYKSFRDIIRRELINPKIIYLDCPFDVAAERDQKGLYKKAIAGEVKDFFGVDVIYQVPTKPDFKIKTDKVNSFNTVRNIRRFLSEWL